METWAIVLICIAVILLVLILLPIIGGIIYRATTRKSGTTRLDDKTIIITGASAGVGKEAAYALARMGPRIIMACRNLTKAQPIAEDIIKVTGNENVVVKQLDVSDFESVRKFAAEINEEEPNIHVLLNNAGIGGGNKRETNKQGFELITATNHYGAFLLTNLLAGKLKASAPSRVLTVASSAMEANVLDIDDLNYETRKYMQILCYCQSKLCNVLFSNELARRLEGTGVTSNSLHPGVVATEFFTKLNKKSVGGFVAKIVGRNQVEGAQNSIYLCSSPEVEGKTGGYYVNCKEVLLRRKAADKDLAKRLWEKSVKDVGLSEAETAVLTNEK